MIDKAEVAHIENFGAKLRECRELSGPSHIMSVTDAAGLLGVSKVELQNIEHGIDTESVALSLVIRAATMFDVSCDWLLGLAGDDFERDPAVCFEREIGRWLHKAHMMELAKVVVDHQRQQKRQNILVDIIGKLLPLVDGVFESLEAFRQANKGFNEMPIGSQLSYRTRLAHQTANECKYQLMHGKLIPVPENKCHDE